MDPGNARALVTQLIALRTFVRNVAQLGRSLPDNRTAEEYRRMYKHISETLADANLSIYAPNISYWLSGGPDRGLWPAHQAEIVNSGTRLISYLEASLEATQPVESAPATVEPTPHVFISHGRPSLALDRLKDFIRALGLVPVVVAEQASQGMSLDSKVVTYLKPCAAAIILATGDDSIEGSVKSQPRQNVIHEVGLAQQLLADRLIYLLEEDTEFPSNIAPKVYERFTDGNLTLAFIAIARDLRAFGVL